MTEFIFSTFGLWQRHRNSPPAPNLVDGLVFPDDVVASFAIPLGAVVCNPVYLVRLGYDSGVVSLAHYQLHLICRYSALEFPERIAEDVCAAAIFLHNRERPLVVRIPLGPFRHVEHHHSCTRREIVLSDNVVSAGNSLDCFTLHLRHSIPDCWVHCIRELLLPFAPEYWGHCVLGVCLPI